MIRIAVCDDEVIFVRCLRDMVEALFEKQGMEFQCFVYTNAPELIQAHRKEEFQLLFLDIDMPEMSGIMSIRTRWGSNAVNSPRTPRKFCTTRTSKFHCSSWC